MRVSPGPSPNYLYDIIPPDFLLSAMLSPFASSQLSAVSYQTFLG